MGAYDRVTWRGHTFDKMTVAALEEVERRLGWQLNILQGSYNSGVSASAGTHDGGGAVDVAPDRYATVVLTMRRVGFAAWHRAYLPGEWPEHIHAILIGNKELSSGAADQVRYYYQGLDGLAGHGPDNGPRLQPIPTFNYREASPYRDGDVYVHKLRFGVRGSDSVRRLQFRLSTTTPARAPHLTVDGDYGPATVEVVKHWQHKVGAGKPDDGRTVSEGQAHRILGDRYKVHP